MREIFRRSHPERRDAGSFLWQWWACWIGANILGRFSDLFFRKSTTASGLEWGNILWILSIPLGGATSSPHRRLRIPPPPRH